MLTRLLLVLALCLSFGTATSAQDFLEPPARLIRPFPGGTTVKYFPKSEMWERCNTLAGRQLPRHPAECGKWRWVLNGQMLEVGVYRKGAKKRCFVYINDRFRGTETGELLFEHGRAHCHGWWHPLRKRDHAQ